MIVKYMKLIYFSLRVDHVLTVKNMSMLFRSVYERHAWEIGVHCSVLEKAEVVLLDVHARQGIFTSVNLYFFPFALSFENNLLIFPSIAHLLTRLCPGRPVLPLSASAVFSR